ncbi:alpha/beta hydrolase [Leisingera sp. HS039]|uniref:alpha/beta fold hydrolase n=1 Tax=unclassified Leisingera TaxID=2614906 RepID=UPI001070D2E2|nr:alpha/beta hydrolase [Leisingera sp. NJS201]MBQ4824711.1 alpha/beta hydrolase [Leisingera sp. HS039]QBR35582.1 alpha/beta hydrolase [Leisingera sp. NJS201]
MTLLCRAQALSQDQVVAAIYETMIRAEQFDRFSAGPPTGGRAGEGNGRWRAFGQPRPVPALKAHFSRAAQIQEQQWERAGRPHPGEYSGECCRFWLLAGGGSEGRLLNASQRAARQLVSGGDLAAAMGLTRAATDRWSIFLEQVREGEFSWQDVLLLGTGRPGERYLCRPVRLKGAGGPVAAVMAERLDCEWSAEAAGPVASAFGLQKSDLDPLKAVMSGAGGRVAAELEQIAARAGAPGTAELIRLAAFLINEHVRDLKIARGELLPPSEEIEDRSGRRSQFFRFGAETGQPVIFVHGVLDGIVPLQRLQPQLRTLGFRVYAPMRAGYGGSVPLQRGQDPADAFVQQLDALITRENLQRPVLLSHRGGALYGCAAANRLHSRISGLVAVASNCSITSPRQFSGLSGYAWLVAFSAARARWMLPVLMKAWSGALHWYGHKALLKFQTVRNSRERAMLDQLGLLPLLKQSQLLFRQQGGAGFLADVQMIRQGTQKMALTRHTRAVFVHGGEDHVAPLSDIRDTFGGQQNAQLCVSQEAGALLFYTLPELVLTALQDCVSAAQGKG